MMEQMEQAVPCRLVIESEENRGMVFPLRERAITIGRGPQNNIQIIDTRMSRIHARLDRTKEGWMLRNLQSKNGIMINSMPVLDTHKLSAGDQIHIGNTIFTFEPDVVAPVEERASDSQIKWLDEEQLDLETSQIMEIPADDDEKGITEVPAGGEERLRSIYKIGKLIQSILDLDELLGKVMEITCQVLHPTQACIMLYDKQRNALIPKVSHRPAGSTAALVISGSIIHQAMEDRVAVLMSDGMKDERFKKSDSVVRQQITSAICSPLVSKGEVLGALYLDTRGTSKHYTDADLQWATGVAGQAAMGIAISLLHTENIAKHEREKELQIARDIQRNLLPRTMPKIQGFEFGGISEPARTVGGDYFDLIPLEDGNLAITIADVSGKGVPAALLLAAFRTAVKMETRDLRPDNLVQVVERLNEAVCRDATNNMFIAMVLAHFDPKSRILTCCNAGHAFPILRLANGEFKTLESGGCFLGIMPGMEFASGEEVVPPGSLLVLTTDGVTDALNSADEAFGSERLHEFIRNNVHLSASDFCKHLEKAVSDFRGEAEQFDDLTVVAIRAV